MLGSIAIVAATNIDLHWLRSQMGLNREDFRRIHLSRLYGSANTGNGFALAGPVVGAPYAVMVLETLVAWGARRVLFLGWCGAISKRVRIGDLVVPTGAIIGEGTSAYYRNPSRTNPVVLPSSALVDEIRQNFCDLKLTHHEGTIWSTDAVFRETRRQVKKLCDQGVLAVEMELSALFTVGRFRGVDVAAVLVVSDSLSSLEWEPGFKTESFEKGRQRAAGGILQICRNL